MPTATRKIIRFLVLFFRRLKSVQTAGTGKSALSPVGGECSSEICSDPLCSLNNCGLITAGFLSVGAWTYLAFWPRPMVAIIRFCRRRLRSGKSEGFHVTNEYCRLSKWILLSSSSRQVQMTSSPSPSAKPASK